MLMAGPAHPVFNPVSPYRYLLLNLYLSVADIENPDLFVFVCRTWIRLDISRFYKEQYQPSSGSMTGLPKNVNWAPIAGGRRNRHNLHRLCQTTVTAPPRVGHVVWSPHNPSSSSSNVPLAGCSVQNRTG